MHSIKETIMLLKKKLAVLGLAAVMTVAFMPAMAFAAAYGTIPANGKLTGNVAYKLDGDLTRNLTVGKRANVTLELDGHTLTNVGTDDTITVENGGTLTITDNSRGNKGTIDNVSHGKAAVFNNGTVKIKDGVNVTRSHEDGKKDSNSYYNIVNHGTMTIENANVNQGGNFSSLIENGYYSYNNTSDNRQGHVEGTNVANPTLTINGGSFSGGINTVKNDDGAKLIINGGTFTNQTQASVFNWNIATINGGTFKTSENSTAGIIDNGNCDDTLDKGELTINGGSYSGNTLLGSNGGAVSIGTVFITAGDFTDVKTIAVSDYNGAKCISGGTFRENPTDYIAGDTTVRAEVTNGTSTTYAVGAKAIQKAAEDSGNTVAVTEGSVDLTGANAKIINGFDNVNGRVTVDGFDVKDGTSVQPNASQTIKKLQDQIANLQKQIQAAASQGSTAKANITSLKSNLEKAQAELKEAQAQVSEGKTLLTAPGQVMNLKAKAGKRSAKLTWKAQTENTTGYRIYRKVKGGKYARVKTITKATQGSWTNKGLKKGKTYYFKVRAYKSITSGELWGAYSNTAKAKVK
ncbi:MAG TPA: hypothetical protein DCS59_06220 [Eubacterium sp.]|nr:hypothetical protein [Eubacterium sp.]